MLPSVRSPRLTLPPPPARRPGSRRGCDSDAAALSRGHRHSRGLHSGFTVEGIRTPGMPSTTVLLLEGTAVMAVPFLLRS